ncbi:hypothetical protein WEI85_43810 [Actinomycetes bacterium KLBMP 9797]
MTPDPSGTAAVPGGVGLMSSIEDEDYQHPAGPRHTRIREDWNATRVKLAGVDVGKLLWFYRPDGDAEVAEAQRQLVRDLVARCADLSLPLVVTRQYGRPYTPARDHDEVLQELPAGWHRTWH